MFKKCLSIMKVSYNYKIRNPVFSISLTTNSKKRGIFINRKERIEKRQTQFWYTR